MNAAGRHLASAARTVTSASASARAITSARPTATCPRRLLSSAASMNFLAGGAEPQLRLQEAVGLVPGRQVGRIPEVVGATQPGWLVLASGRRLVEARTACRGRERRAAVLLNAGTPAETPPRSAPSVSPRRSVTCRASGALHSCRTTERGPDVFVDREPAILPGEHVGGGSSRLHH